MAGASKGVTVALCRGEGGGTMGGVGGIKDVGVKIMGGEEVSRDV